MGRIQEAKYIKVDWQNRETANSIKVSDDALAIESIDDNTVEIDIVCFSSINDGSAGQFAIRLESQTTDIPHVKLGDGTSIALRPVTAPDTGHQWWVEGKTWDKKNGYWCSDIYRGVGEVQIKIGALVCRVNISTSTFTHQQLEQYLLDFKTDFLELIFDQSSYINAPVQHNERTLLDKTTLLAISKFIECTELLLENPKVELREVQQLRPRKSVRPVPRTFMELATRGNARLLTSRAYIESWDVPENRYAHYAVRKIYQITMMLCAVAASQERSLKRNLHAHQQRLTTFSDQKKINKDAVIHDLKDTEKAILTMEDDTNKYNERIADLLPLDLSRKNRSRGGYICKFLHVKIDKNINDLDFPTVYYIKYKTINNDWYPDFVDGFATIDLDVFSKEIDSFLGREFEIYGEIGYREVFTSTNKTIIRYWFLKITSFVLLKSVKLAQRLLDHQEQFVDLERKNWVRPLNFDEKQQQKRELESIRKHCEILDSRRLNLKSLIDELLPKLPLLNAALKKFSKEKVKMDSRFPNTMTYVQNPAYQGIHIESMKIKKGSGINDDEILLALDRIESIGLVHISLLYERWCLLQIIKVLINFRYLPELEWKRKLIAQIFSQVRNISINFENPSLHRKLVLNYEFELSNKKRPDFVIDVTADFNNEIPVTKRFVMDAKFYEDISHPRHGGLTSVINELYNKKNYSENRNNSVFIIHPSPQAAPNRSTPQEWSRYSFYGENRLFDWDDEFPNHRYGGIYLSPIDTGNYLDHLQRAIGMFLQYGMEENEEILQSKNGALPDNGLFCLVCGSSEVECRKSRNNPKAWWTICNNCNHFTTYNFCFDCKNRLIKNGEYWSYHAMEPLNPINIKCPSCGGFF